MSEKPAFEYPEAFREPWKLKDGRLVKIRPIRPEDEAMMVEFHQSLSEQTVYLRYFYYMKLSVRTAHERLARICSIDPKNEMVIVAVIQNPGEEENAIAAVGRLNRYENSNDAEIAALVSDAYQGQGLGSEMLNRLLHIGYQANLDRIYSEILPENRIMQAVNEKLDFPCRHYVEDEMVKAVFSMVSEKEPSHK